ncbi:Proline-rich protein 5-like [Fukomys damarensis]|uniref:Proline-rich protein 5-like n=1 Tax=Fukomys damarensis TaxID=885580 RepID=A0A091CPD2_FUKDA|nr:Proline-rich protein 5-like [Fukomys damarensis]
MTRGLAPILRTEFHKMGSFGRPRRRFMSSPVLSDLPRFQATRQALQLSSNSAWNSVQTAVINVFKGGGLQSNELYALNENIRRLLKSELGSFITDYFQNQLLAKGLFFVEEKINLYEGKYDTGLSNSAFDVWTAEMLPSKTGENRIEVLAEVWDHFFTETLPTLQAIFYPVQGQELTIRQISLLGFRDLVLLKVKLGDLLLLSQAKLPSSIVQMLLILQSVHEPTGPSESYLQLEELVKQVVSPFLGIGGDRGFSGSTHTLDWRVLVPACCLPSSLPTLTPSLTGSTQELEAHPAFSGLRSVLQLAMLTLCGGEEGTPRKEHGREDFSGSGGGWHATVIWPGPVQGSSVHTAQLINLVEARRHSRVRPKMPLLNYASPLTTVSRPVNEMALTPLTEQEGEAYLEKCGSVRRHTVANAHSDIQLLAMATMMHAGLGEEAGSEDKCLLLPPRFSPPHRQCSSEPNITDSPDELEEVAGDSQEDAELNCASLS